MSGLELWWLGQSGFRLRDPDGGPVLFIDPFISEHPKRTWQAPVGPAALAQADLVLCTHEHIDHFDQPALRAAVATDGSCFSLVVPTPIVDQAMALGIPANRIIGAQPGTPIEYHGARIFPVPARHGIHVSDAYSFGEDLSNGMIRYLGFVIELGGVRVYHAGDSIPYDGLAADVEPLHPQIALLPINGRDFFRETEHDIVGNMEPREAVQVAQEIGARVLVPMHWEMFPHNLGFPEDVEDYVSRLNPDLTVLTFGRGARLTYRLDPDEIAEGQP